MICCLGQFDAIHNIRAFNEEDAKDCSQNTFFKLFKSNEIFKTESHIKAWLITVTIHECANVYRQSWKKYIHLKEDMSTFLLRKEELQDLVAEQSDDTLEKVLELPVIDVYCICITMMDQIHTSEQWIQDTLDICYEDGQKQNKTSGKGIKKIRKARKLYPILVAIVAVVIIVPLSVVAANHLMSVSKNEEGADVIMNRGTIAIEDIVSMKIDVSYIPEGMVKYDRGPKYYYEQTPNQGGFSLHLWKLDSETDNFEFPVNNAVSSKDMIINGYEAILIRKRKQVPLLIKQHLLKYIILESL